MKCVKKARKRGGHQVEGTAQTEAETLANSQPICREEIAFELWCWRRLLLKYSAAREVCIFIMSYTQFGCFQPRFLKIALSAPFPFFSSCGIPVVQMLDQLLLSQRFLRLLIFFVCLFVCLFSLVFRLGKFYCYILKFTDSICHFYY